MYDLLILNFGAVKSISIYVERVRVSERERERARERERRKMVGQVGRIV